MSEAMTGERPPNHNATFYVVLAALAGIFIGGTVYSLFVNPKGLGSGPAGFNWDALGVLVAVGMTLALYSFLYEDNPFFKAAEHLYVGIGLGYSIVGVAWFEYIKPEAYKQFVKYAVRPETPGHADWALLPALILSALMLARLIPRLGWLSRIPVAFIVGFTAATQVPNFIQAQILKQIEDTIVPLSAAGAQGVTAASLLTLFGQLVILVGVASVLLYFFFSVEHKGAIGVGSRIGVWFLMISFGASFGYTVMGRMALLVKRLHFLLGDWLGINLG